MLEIDRGGSVRPCMGREALVFFLYGFDDFCVLGMLLIGFGSSMRMSTPHPQCHLQITIYTHMCHASTVIDLQSPFMLRE